MIGAGTMGNGIAHVAGLGGLDVCMVDVSREAVDQGLSTIRKNLDRQLAKGRVDQETVDATMSRIRTDVSLPDAVSDVQMAIEAAPERPDLKHDLFRALDAAAPEGAILATNTSSISITELAARTARPEAVIGMHFMNPVPVMKLVEVIRGLATSDATTSAVMELARALGKTPVEVNDSPGFVSNRVLMPMINEAAFCLLEGVGEAEAIDTVMKLGMNHPMGPLALADLIGLDTCLNILEVLHQGLGEDKYRPCPLLRKHVAAGWLGRKAGRGFYVYE